MERFETGSRNQPKFSMDAHDLRTLRILEEIDKNQSNSQRELSRKLNVSLGLVNLFVKRLASKGYLKVTTIPRNRMQYILTPKGMAEKTQLTAQYIHHSFKFYRDTRTIIRSLLNSLSKQKVRTILFLGVTELAEIAYVLLKETPIEFIGVIDAERKGEIFLGETVMHSSQIRELEFDQILITSLEPGRKWVNYLADLGVPPEKVTSIY
jgi:DNA-binding MarR family transcriptional regulator